MKRLRSDQSMSMFQSCPGAAQLGLSVVNCNCSEIQMEVMIEVEDEDVQCSFNVTDTEMTFSRDVKSLTAPWKLAL